MRKRLLVVVNERRLRSDLCCHLSNQGYDVSTASEGKIAVRVLDRASFDLVVIDLQVPDMDAAILVGHIRSFAPTTLILAVSQRIELVTILGLLRNGVYGYLAKPFQFADLERRIRQALDSRYKLFLQIGERHVYHREYDICNLLINRSSLTESALTPEDIYRSNNILLNKISLIQLRPLRERMEDLPSIAEYLVTQSSLTFLKPILGLETDAMQCLLAHSWPGNIEELRLALEHGVKSCKTKYIGLSDLPVYLQNLQYSPPPDASLLH